MRQNDFEKAHSAPENPNPQERIAFYDLEGVFTFGHYDPETLEAAYSKTASLLANRLCKVGDMRIVCIGGEALHKQDSVYERLDKAGLKQGLFHPEWLLLNYDHRGDRSRAVRLFLRAHPEVKDFVIIDNDPWATESEFKDNAIPVDDHYAFTIENARQACRIMGIPSELAEAKILNINPITLARDNMLREKQAQPHIA